MYLGDGEYLIVSMCLRTPYDFKKIDSLMKEIFFNHKIDRIEATYFDILPQEANYYKIWSGEFKECDLKLFSINMLEDKFLSLLDLEFDNKIVARLQIEFLDDTWYEISMIFNFTKLIDEEKSIELKKYNAKATFFCIGDNIRKYPEIFKKVIEEGHSIGNHTFNHLNGWKTSKQEYLENTKKCQSAMERGE